MDEKRGKWIDYFDLKDAMKGPGCPLCGRMETLSLKFLDSLFYERVTDVWTRVGLRRARGFCNWHAWMSAGLPSSSSGIAIIYKDLLDAEIGELSKWLEGQGFSPNRRDLRRQRKKSARFLPYLKSKASCPVCKSIREREKMDMRALLDFIDEEEFSEAFEQSSGICLKHLVRLIQNHGEHPHLGIFMEKQVRKYRSLSEELEEFIRKLDYRFSREPKGPEADSWKRVIEQFAGKKGVFGSDVDDGTK